MGVINVTPDSFSDGGKFLSAADAIVQARKLISEGAHIIDVGGESSRPGAEPVSAEEELSRVLPIVRALKKLPIVISVDTRKSQVALAVLKEGADIINDITGFRDPKMISVVKKFGAGAVVMHMQGTPQDMQKVPFYKDVVFEVKDFLSARVKAIQGAGVRKIAIDPGIGFGKTFEHNLALLGSLHEFKSIGVPICIGVSRKSFIGKITGEDASGRLEGTIASNVLALSSGAGIFRVHDVAQNKKALDVAYAVISGRSGCGGDCLVITGLKCRANAGVTAAERRKKQPLSIDAELFCDLQKVAETGEVSDTADYSDVCAQIKSVAESEEFELLEQMAKRIIDSLKEKFSVQRVRVRIGKDAVAKRKGAKFLGVELIE